MISTQHDHPQSGLVGFATSLFTRVATRTDRQVWLWSALAAVAFAVSVPVTPFAPLMGHLLLLGNLVAIILPALRGGFRGAAMGLVLTLAPFQAALATIVIVGAPQPFGPNDLLVIAGACLLIAVCCGGLGQSMLRQRRLAESIARTERRMTTFVNAMPSGFLVLDLGGRIVFSNTRARALLNTDRPEEFDIALPHLVSPEAWPLLCERLLDVTPGAPVRVTIPGETPIRTEWVFSSLRDGGKHFALAYFWDAEEKLQREEETRAVAAALRCLQEGVVLANLDGTIRYANPAAVQIYGYADRREVIGSPLRSLVADRDLDGFPARMERARTVGGSCEIRLRRPDGGETDAHVTTSPVHMDGQLIGTVGVLRDLTEAKVLAGRASAADKQASLGRLVAGAAHEINNPLTAITASAELLLADLRGNAEAEELLQVVQTECARAGRIVRDLLSYARQRPVARTPVELAGVVESAVALRAAYARAAGIELVLTTPAAARVEVDPDQIKQVVLNLLANAEDAVAGAAERRISVTIGQRAGRALLLINDSGPGVAEGIQHQIFEPFFTTKPEGQGTGLGLSVSSGIISEHGGRISVSRGVFGGAQFAVELPLAMARPATGPACSPGEAAAPKRALRILVVDDEAAILGSVGRILRRLGHEVRTAVGGGDGLALALEETFDVIISDLRMPGLSGRELYAHLVQEGIVPHTDFIVATGDIADPEAYSFLQETGLPVLLKPFEIRELVELLARCRPPVVKPALVLAS